VQLSFQHTYGKLFASLLYQRTFHTGKAYGGFPLLNSQDHALVRRVRCDNSLPGVLSFFEDEQKRPYVVFVNNSQDKNGRFTLEFDGKVRAVYHIKWGGEEENIEKLKGGVKISLKENGYECSTWIAPGQMEVYRLEV
jgi:hypothetical protein